MQLNAGAACSFEFYFFFFFSAFYLILSYSMVFMYGYAMDIFEVLKIRCPSYMPVDIVISDDIIISVCFFH